MLTCNKGLAVANMIGVYIGLGHCGTTASYDQCMLSERATAHHRSATISLPESVRDKFEAQYLHRLSHNLTSLARCNSINQGVEQGPADGHKSSNRDLEPILLPRIAADSHPRSEWVARRSRHHDKSALT
jgi:hypothetical protein